MGAKILKDNLRIQDSVYVGSHTFKCGHTVPIYEVNNLHSLNQMIGHAKFNNSKYGKVYYRGECHLHDNLTPSLFRGAKRYAGLLKQMNDIVRQMKNDPKFPQTLNSGQLHEDEKVEGLLQHYGVPTTYIDVVDNHWVALWMGLYKCSHYSKLNDYLHYSKRELPIGDIAKGKEFDDKELYQYILLISLPYNTSRNDDGVNESEDFLQVDLRQALPSIFLRPHAQHGLVFRRKVHQLKLASDYDVADTVVGILKIRIDHASKWLGNGELLTQENLFPAPGFDHGYDILLSRSDLFEGSRFKISQYI